MSREVGIMLLELKFKPRYFCIGFFWRKVKFAKNATEYKLYIFLLPMIALCCIWTEVRSRYE